MRFHYSLIALLAWSSAHAALNDTGQIRCLANGEPVECSKLSAPAGQDAQSGRDADAAVGKLRKFGGSVKGFDFTPLDANGQTIPVSAEGKPQTPPACVRDNVTGLVWQEVKLRYVKHYVSFPVVESAQNEINYSRYCGLSDWRLPSTRELLSIMDYGEVDPMFDLSFFPGSTSDRFWTADVPLSRWEHRRVIDFSLGSTETRSPNLKSYFRFVSGRSQDSSFQTDAGAGLALDTTSVLTWDTCTLGAKGLNCGQGAYDTVSWTQALELVQKANVARYKGYADWRLPNIKELQTLVASRHFGCPMANEQVFPATACAPYWSSTFNTYRPRNAWQVDFNDGNLTYGAISRETGLIRLVRNSGPATP